MGARFEIVDKRVMKGEAYGDLSVKTSVLKNCKIERDSIPNIIDEIPVLAVAGLFAEGDFEIDGIGELRFKESDRIKAVCDNMRLAGVNVEEYPEGFRLTGEPRGVETEFKSFKDHRIAMTFAVLALLLDIPVMLDNPDAVRISNPRFFEQLSRISIAS
jgi:3-phosphoshikimate 1-carboxyvinyltransferase